MTGSSLVLQAQQGGYDINIINIHESSGPQTLLGRTSACSNLRPSQHRSTGPSCCASTLGVSEATNQQGHCCEDCSNDGNCQGSCARGAFVSIIVPLLRGRLCELCELRLHGIDLLEQKAPLVVIEGSALHTDDVVTHSSVSLRA